MVMEYMWVKVYLFYMKVVGVCVCVCICIFMHECAHQDIYTCAQLCW